MAYNTSRLVEQLAADHGAKVLAYRDQDMARPIEAAEHSGAVLVDVSGLHAAVDIHEEYAPSPSVIEAIMRYEQFIAGKVGK